MSTVSFSECLEIINRKDKKGNPIPFDANVYTLNRNSKKGGLLKSYKKAKLLAWNNQERTLKSLTKYAQAVDKVKRNPNHFQNRTRNIEVPDKDRPVKIHLRLIDSINGKKVVP